MGKAESEVEQYLVNMVMSLGGIPYKFKSPARNNVPDRMCVFPGGGVMFVECKAPDGKLSVGQLHEIKRLQMRQQTVVVVSTKIEVDAVKHILTGGVNDGRVRGSHTANGGVSKNPEEGNPAGEQDSEAFKDLELRLRPF